MIVILHARRRSGRVEQHGTDQVASRVIQTTPIVKTVVGQHAKSVGRTSVADAARTLASTTNGRVGTPDEATSSIALHKHKQRNKAKDHLLERKGKEKKKKKISLLFFHSHSRAYNFANTSICNENKQHGLLKQRGKKRKTEKRIMMDKAQRKAGAPPNNTSVSTEHTTDLSCFSKKNFVVFISQIHHSLQGSFCPHGTQSLVA